VEDSKPADARISVAYHYGVAFISVTIGIAVVILLNLFTPLDIIHTSLSGRTGSAFLPSVLTFILPRLLLTLGCVYGVIFLGLRHLLKPISACIRRYRIGEVPDEEQLSQARKRLLNLHNLFAGMNVLLWCVIPALTAAAAIIGDYMDAQTAIIFAARSSMVGLIVASIATLRIEIASRRNLIPFFFPTGVLGQVEGVKQRSISQRIMFVTRLGAIVPVVILLVTLLTAQWELEGMTVSAVSYGRELIVFTLVMICWVFVFSWQLSRLQSRNIVEPINELVSRLKGVEKGEFDTKILVTSNDEVGYAGEVVNAMTVGLKERLAMKRSLDLAREVQQNLLPRHDPDFPGLDIAGTSTYCDETGGDYYDYLELGNDDNRKFGVVIGDVSGHGIASALIMATTRGFFRQRCALPGSMAEIVSDVNRQLSWDIADSGSFMTMFCLFIDTRNRELDWIRAGHDPAILYDSETDEFTELKGVGIALGVDPDFHYPENETLKIHRGQIIVLGTDGIWEALNPSGEMFGKARLNELLQENADRSAAEILEKLMQSHAAFRGGNAAEDDITCVVISVTALS